MEEEEDEDEDEKEDEAYEDYAEWALGACSWGPRKRVSHFLEVLGLNGGALVRCVISNPIIMAIENEPVQTMERRQDDESMTQQFQPAQTGNGLDAFDVHMGEQVRYSMPCIRKPPPALLNLAEVEDMQVPDLQGVVRPSL